MVRDADGECHARHKKKTRQLLTELVELDIYVKMQEYVDKLVAFTPIAVCGHQQDPIIWKLKSHLREGSSTQATSTTADLQTERDRRTHRSGSALMKPESGLNPPRKERGIRNSGPHFSDRGHYILVARTTQSDITLLTRSIGPITLLNRVPRKCEGTRS